MRCERRILHIRWHDYIPNNEVLRHTGLLAASSIVRKRRLGLFGHVARLADDVPANRILRTCCEAQDGVRPCCDWRRARGRPPTTWTQQICRDTGVTVSDALRLADDRSFWRQIVTARSYGWALCVQEGRKTYHKKIKTQSSTYSRALLPVTFRPRPLAGLLHEPLPVGGPPYWSRDSVPVFAANSSSIHSKNKHDKLTKLH